MNSDIIRIKNAVFYAYHGVGSEEQSLGGNYEVDLELSGDLAAAKSTDNLKRTIDYEGVYAVTQSIVTAQKYYLIETLANAIVKGIIHDFPLVQRVTVRVRKPHPPVKGVIDYVEVEVMEER